MGGQMIGVSYGAPTEFAYLDRLGPEDEMPVWKPEMISEALNQDDSTSISRLRRHWTNTAWMARITHCRNGRALQ